MVTLTSRRIVALVLLLVVGATACASTRRADNPFRGGGGGAATIELQVENLAFNEATLYALSTGARHTLGRVGGKETRTFTIPWRGRQRLRVEIRLLAGDEHTTNAVSIAPGETAELLIQSRVRRSYLRR